MSKGIRNFNGDIQKLADGLNKKFGLDGLFKLRGNRFQYFVFVQDKRYTINYFDTTGKLTIQPAKAPAELVDSINDVVDNISNNIKINMNKEIFIVHGHDKYSKQELENILYKWGIRPYAIQDNDSRGQTIIEFLEKEIKNRLVGIVLLSQMILDVQKKNMRTKKNFGIGQDKM